MASMLGIDGLSLGPLLAPSDHVHTTGATHTPVGVAKLALLSVPSVLPATTGVLGPSD